MNEFLASFAFALTVTGPTFIVLVLGIVFKRIGLLNESFIEGGSKLVFNVSLPILLFMSVSKTQFDQSANFAIVGYGIVVTLISYTLLELISYFFVKPSHDRGVFVQGAFRSNMGIIGLAYCVNAYGQTAIGAASLYLGIITILFNILSVITLSRSLHKGASPINAIAKGIATNPLIIGILLALPFSYFQWHLPALVLKAGDYLANLALPLALLCTGATLNFRSLQQAMGNTIGASLAKLALVPTLFGIGAYLVGFRGIDMGIIMLMAFAPTAAASYVMARAMGGNANLAANIIVLTTLGSLVSTSLGIMILKSWQLM